jgi:hypothetical protein
MFPFVFTLETMNVEVWHFQGTIIFPDILLQVLPLRTGAKTKDLLILRPVQLNP